MVFAEIAENGKFAPGKLAATLLTTVDEVAQTAGLSRDAVARAARARTPKTQKRLREMVEILTRVSPRFGSDLLAYAWYRSTPLGGYGDVTAMRLVQDGRAEAVHRFLDRLDAGVHA